MAGMGTYLDVLRMLNELPGGLPNLPPTAPVVAPTTAPPGPPPVNASAAFSLPPVAPPAAPMPGLDQGLISQLSGPAPVAPVAPQRSRFDRIIDALAGVSAGLQGQGPQFLANLKEERARPMREFKAEQERFQQRRAGATEFAERRRGQQQEQTQRIAERNFEREEREFERELQARVRREGFEDRVAIAKLEDAMRTEREAAKAKADAEEQARKDMEARKSAVLKLAGELFDDLKISRQQARAIAEHEINQTPLSAADAKIYTRLEKYRRPVGGGGGAASDPLMAVLEDGQVVPASLVNRDVGAVMLGGAPIPVIRYVGGKIPQQAQPTAQAAPQFSPWNLAATTGGMLPPPQAAQQPQQQTFTRAQVEAFARKTKRKPEDVEADIRARGGNVR